MKATKCPSPLMTGAKLAPLPWVPSSVTERRIVDATQPAAPVHVSCRNTSVVLLVSPETTLLASDSNAMKRPSALKDPPRLSAVGAAPPVATETSAVLTLQPAGAPIQVSRTKIAAGFPPELKVSKITKRPVPLIELEPAPFALCDPASPCDTRIVEGVQPAGAPTQVSRRKTSSAWSGSSDVILSNDSKATNRPSLLMTGISLSMLPG